MIQFFRYLARFVENFQQQLFEYRASMNFILRFTSLQKRNMLEVRKKVMPHRKYKLKHVEKWRKKLPEEIDELVKMKRKKKKIKLSE